jgi:hypothetical protein
MSQARVVVRSPSVCQRHSGGPLASRRRSARRRRHQRYRRPDGEPVAQPLGAFRDDVPRSTPLTPSRRGRRGRNRPLPRDRSDHGCGRRRRYWRTPGRFHCPQTDHADGRAGLLRSCYGWCWAGCWWSAADDNCDRGVRGAGRDDARHRVGGTGALAGRLGRAAGADCSGWTGVAACLTLAVPELAA